MPSIDAMKAELEAARYGVTIGDMLSEVVTPDGFIIKALFSYHEERVIERAYAHLIKERQFEAMKALVEQVAGARYPSLIWDITTLEWVKEAKTILGKQD